MDQSDNIADPSDGGRLPVLNARAWRMLLHASLIEDELHVFEPWIRKGSRVPTMEESLSAAASLLERGLCRSGSGAAWIQITAEGRAFVNSQRERYLALYPYVLPDRADRAATE